MKIAMVSEHASPLAVMGGEDAGGQNVHVAALSSHLARLGHEVTVWTRRDDPALPRRVTFHGVDVVHVDAGPARAVPKDQLPRWMATFARALTRAWQQDAPDVIHSHFWMSGGAALRARPSSVPLVHTYHALGTVKRRHLGTADPSPRHRLDAEAGLAVGVDRIIATCRDEVRELQRMTCPIDHVDVVPCGVDLSAFSPRRAAQETRAHRARIVVVGRLVRRKGVDDVIRALSRLPGVDLVVAGGPAREGLARDPEVGRLRALARRIGVAERVDLRGAVRRCDVPALLRSASVVVCAAWYEPFGIVPLEAMACGTPVVATAVGGMRDTVVDGGTGLHVPPRDPGAIADAVRWLLADDDRRRAIGAAGRQRAERLYGWPTVADATVHSYHAAVGARRYDHAGVVEMGTR